MWSNNRYRKIKKQVLKRSSARIIYSQREATREEKEPRQ